MTGAWRAHLGRMAYNIRTIHTPHVYHVRTISIPCPNHVWPHARAGREHGHTQQADRGSMAARGGQIVGACSLQSMRMAGAWRAHGVCVCMSVFLRDCACTSVYVCVCLCVRVSVFVLVCVCLRLLVCVCEILWVSVYAYVCICVCV